MSVQLLTGDCLDVLRTLPAESVDCCVTSPPYWGLRDYGVDGQIGLEASLAEHMDVMVAVFEEVRRVLKPHGSLWLNYGDCYATTPNGRSAAAQKAAGTDDRTFRDKPFSTVGPIQSRSNGGEGQHFDRRGGILKPKDLCMLANRLAIALQDAGWWVRSEIVWGKPNAMPDSSGNARPSVAHEKLFLLTKSGDADIWRARDTGELSFAPDLSERCPLITKPSEMAARWLKLGSYYDAGAVMMNLAEASVARLAQDLEIQNGSSRASGGRKTNGTMKAVRTTRPRGAVPPPVTPRREGQINHTGLAAVETGGGRLLRNYEPDISALVPAQIMAWEIAIAGFSGAHFATFPPALVVPCILAGCPKGGTVLDPFGGAGTTGMVADALGREAILIELNHDYAQLARDRLRAALARVESDLPERVDQELGGLFGASALPSSPRSSDCVIGAGR